MYKYGILIGRFQPLHLGHQAIISEIIADGLRPLILIGSSESGKTDKNPYDFFQRKGMIFSVYGNNVDYLALPDFPDNERWVNYILKVAKSSIIYYHKKEEDCKKEWGDGHYIDLLDGKIPIKQSTYATKINIPISATRIRNDIEGNKHFLDGRVYKLITRTQQNGLSRIYKK